MDSNLFLGPFSFPVFKEAQVLFPLTEALCVVIAAVCLLLAVALILVCLIGTMVGGMDNIGMVLFLIALILVSAAFYLLRPRSQL